MKRYFSEFQSEILSQLRNDMLQIAWIESVAKDYYCELDPHARLHAAYDEIVDLAECGLVILGTVDFHTTDDLLSVSEFPVPRTKIRLHAHKIIDLYLSDNNGDIENLRVADPMWIELTHVGMWVSSEYHAE